MSLRLLGWPHLSAALIFIGWLEIHPGPNQTRISAFNLSFRGSFYLGHQKYALVMCVYVTQVCVCESHSSHVQLFATLWNVARQAPLSMGILQARILEWVAISLCRGSSQPNDPRSPALQADSLLSEPPWKPLPYIIANVTAPNQINLLLSPDIPIYKNGAGIPSQRDYCPKNFCQDLLGGHPHFPLVCSGLPLMTLRQLLEY